MTLLSFLWPLALLAVVYGLNQLRSRRVPGHGSAAVAPAANDASHAALSAGDLPRLFVLAVVNLIAIASAYIVYIDEAHWIRQVIVLPFLLFGPGYAIVRMLRISTLVEEITLALALSIAIDILVATSILYAALWSAVVVVATLAALTVAFSIVALVLANTPARTIQGEP